MNRTTTIRWLLSILVIASIALVPMSRPVMAAMSHDASMQISMQSVSDDVSASATADKMAMDDMAMSAMAMDEMAGDMPCCPSKAPMPMGCDKCIFMAACMTKCFSGMMAAVFQPLFVASAGLARPQNESWPDSLGHPPPDQPPRILI